MQLYDSVSYWHIPTTAQSICYWNSGPYRWPQSAITSFPTPFKFSATPFPTVTADFYDCEAGDFPIRTIPAILRRFGHKAIYIQLSNWTAAKSVVASEGLTCDWWVADWTNTPHLLPGSIATQYTDNHTLYDVSTITTAWVLSHTLVERSTPTMPAAIGTGYMLFTGITKTNHKLAFIVENSQHANSASYSIIDLGDLAVQKKVTTTAEFIE